MRQNNRKIGTKYERLAGAFLEKQGYEILEYNYRCHTGEIDIIARDGRYLVFCEAKYRKTNKSGSPLEAVGVQKQRVISKCALSYIITHGYNSMSCRFDVVGILGDKMQHVRNAFAYIG